MTPLLALTRTAQRTASSASDRYLTHQIARQLGHDPKWCLSPSREAKYVQARAEVAQVLRELGWSYPRVGRAIGRDHAAVMYLLGAGKKGRERQERKQGGMTAKGMMEAARRLAQADAAEMVRVAADWEAEHQRTAKLWEDFQRECAELVLAEVERVRARA